MSVLLHIHGLLAVFLPITVILSSSHVAMVQGTPGARTEALPQRYGMLLFQAFETLDVFGPLDALQMLSRKYKMDLALISATLEPVTTRPGSPSMNPKNSTFFQSIVPTHTLKDTPDLDVLIIPGGLGTRAPNLNSTVEYIAATYPKLQYLLSVCTGAGLAARAGVLDGKRATTNKASWASTISLGPKVNWVGHARWTVDGNIWTSSGVSAGIDLTLAFIKHVYGDDIAAELAHSMEYERHQDPDWDPFAQIFNVTQERI